MEDRTVNLLGALALAISDRIEFSVSAVPGRAGAATAALTTVLAEPGITVRELAMAVGISSSGTVRLLDHLAADGLVQRRRELGGRTVAIHLSSAGQAAARRALAARQRAVEDALAVLPADEQDLLAGFAAKMLVALTDDEETACRICRLCDVAACPQALCPVEQACP